MYRVAQEDLNSINLLQELSGLGDRKLLNSQSIEDRFKQISRVAQTRSIIALGLACFKRDREDKTKNWSYVCQTFNLTVLCSEDYIVEPSALAFLVEHGFDFGKQYAKGISYYRGDDKVRNNS